LRYYLVKESPEIPLKSWRTRPRFERALARAIERALAGTGASFRVRYSQGVFYVEADRDVSDALSRVFGIHDFCEVVPHRFSSLDDIAKRAEELFRDLVAGRRFAVRVKRSGEHSFTSLDVARVVGAALLRYSAGVDLDNPEVEVRIEVRGDYAYYVTRCWRGMGGLPVGTEGRALTLFSGGFDSTLASILAAKRGAEVDFLHLYMGSAEATEAAVAVAKEVAKFFTPHEPRLVVVNFVPVLAEVRSKVEGRLRQVVLRVLMHEVAQALAERLGYDAVVTGESVGQASSQTLKNLRVVDYLVRPRAAILRPLAAADKEEIVSKVRELGLFDYVAKVEEVCRISEGPVETRASVEEVEEALRYVSRDVVEGVVANYRVYDVGRATAEEVLKGVGADVEVEEVPPGWLLVDIRDFRRYSEDHLPGAIHISQLGRVDTPVVLYCDYGSASLLAALELRKAGVQAYSLRGGVVGYRRRVRDVRCGPT